MFLHELTFKTKNGISKSVYEIIGKGGLALENDKRNYSFTSFYYLTRN